MHKRITHHVGDDCPGGHMDTCTTPLQNDEAPYAVCDRCGRKTWDADALGTEDRMTQPDGNPCGGRFTAPGR